MYTAFAFLDFFRRYVQFSFHLVFPSKEIFLLFRVDCMEFQVFEIQILDKGYNDFPSLQSFPQNSSRLVETFFRLLIGKNPLHDFGLFH